jgi:hypothetical protein
MSLSISVRRTAVAALVACSLLATTMSASAGAATPKQGYYSGPTSQQITPSDPAEAPQAGSVDFKVLKYHSSGRAARKLLKVGATTQLTCPSGEVMEDNFLVYIIVGGKIDRLGRFKYSYKGFTLKGRFTTKTSAEGTLSRTLGDCKAEDVSWTAKRTTGGIPIS